MTTTTFDTPGYFEKLKAAGVPEAQARVRTDALRDMTDSRLIPKEYSDIRLAEMFQSAVAPSADCLRSRRMGVVRIASP